MPSEQEYIDFKSYRDKDRENIKKYADWLDEKKYVPSETSHFYEFKNEVLEKEVEARIASARESINLESKKSINLGGSENL